MVHMVPLQPGRAAPGRDAAVAAAAREMRAIVLDFESKHGVDATAQALIDAVMVLAGIHGCQAVAAKGLRAAADILATGKVG